MKDAQDIINDLANFHGTDQWHRYSPILFRNVLLTDGVKFLADECQAYWLMDAISSHLPAVRKRDHFAVVILNVSPTHAAVLTLQDDVPANSIYASQSIESTDFPLDEIKLYVSFDGENWVILLPSEH